MATKLQLTNAGAQLLVNCLNQGAYTKKPGEQIIAALFADTIEMTILGPANRAPKGPVLANARDPIQVAAFREEQEAYAERFDAWERTPAEIEATDRQLEIAQKAVRFHSEHFGEHVAFRLSIHSARLQQELKLNDEEGKEKR